MTPAAQQGRKAVEDSSYGAGKEHLAKPVAAFLSYVKALEEHVSRLKLAITPENGGKWLVEDCCRLAECHRQDSEAVDETEKETPNGADSDFAAVRLARMEELTRLQQDKEALVTALSGIVEIGKRDMSNSKYDGYFEEAKTALQSTEASQ